MNRTNIHNVMKKKKTPTTNKTNLHLVHDSICAQDVVLLVRVTLCML